MGVWAVFGDNRRSSGAAFLVNPTDEENPILLVNALDRLIRNGFPEVQ
jgi:hypothetical protein